MIWADRIGVGLISISIVFFVFLYSIGGLSREPAFQFAWSTSHEEQGPKLEPGKVYTDEELGIDRRSSEPATIWDALNDARRASLIFIVPLRLILRIIDFMAGGQARRRARQPT